MGSGGQRFDAASDDDDVLFAGERGSAERGHLWTSCRPRLCRMLLLLSSLW